MDKVKDLAARIKRLERRKTCLEQWDTIITPLDKFTVDDKVLIFDRLYARARKYLHIYVEDGREPKDGQYHLYEAVLSKMLGGEVWSIIRAIGT